MAIMSLPVALPPSAQSYLFQQYRIHSKIVLLLLRRRYFRINSFADLAMEEEAGDSVGALHDISCLLRGRCSAALVRVLIAMGRRGLALRRAQTWQLRLPSCAYSHRTCMAASSSAVARHFSYSPPGFV